MPNLRGTVGAGGTNSVHDVALVQVMLRVVKDAKNASYFGANYTGTYSDAVKTAIAAFQKDKGLLEAAKPTPGTPPAAKEVEGQIAPGSKTYQTLVANLPAAYANVWAMPNLKTIYLEAPAKDAITSSDQVRTNAGLVAKFRDNVARLIDAFHATHKIALWVEPGNGWNRGFEQQAKIMRNGKTKAGPGESNHNWGMAVDLGFKNLKWLAGDTSIVTDDYWLQKLVAAKANEPGTMWTTRNQVAAGFTLHKSNWKVDLIHIQNFSDDNVSMTNSLAAQLQRVGKFKWDRANKQYTTDMGSGAKQEAVGTAYQLWTKESHPSNSLVAAWKTAQEKAAWAKLPQQAKDKLNKEAVAKLKLPPGAKAPPDPGLKTWKEADVTGVLVEAAKAALRTEMETAESKRDQWKPVS